MRKPRSIFDYEPEYVSEAYGTDFRDELHSSYGVNYFDTVFFSDVADKRRIAAGGVWADYSQSKINVSNTFWQPAEFIAEFGKDIIRKKIKEKHLQEKANQGLIPENHHFYDPEFKGIENNISLRFDDVYVEAGKLLIDARKVTYFDQAATNLAVYNRLLVGGQDLRKADSEIYGNHTKPKHLRDSMLANSLGVACMFALPGPQGVLIPRFRMKKLKGGQGHAVMSGGQWHSSASGVFEYKDLNLGLRGGEKRTVPLSALEAGIDREIESESGLKRGDDYDLQPLCLSREIPRAGKPQMFYKAILNGDKFKSVPDVCERLLAERPIEGWEYDDQMLKTDAFRRIISDLEIFSISSLRNDFSYEGLANLIFAKKVTS